MRDGDWDVVVADISLPSTSGLDSIKELRRTHPAVPTVVLSMHPAAQFARRALSAGAAGYLTKDSAPEELVTAIMEARQGRGDAGRCLRRNRRRKPQRRPTTRSRTGSDQTLRMLGSGQSSSDIARDLGLSAKTIST